MSMPTRMKLCLLASVMLSISSHADTPLQNGSFEQGLDDWAWTGGAAGKVLPQAALDGSSVFEIKENASAPPPPWHLQQEVGDLKPGTVYRLSVWSSSEHNNKSTLRAGEATVALPVGSHNWTETQLDFTASADGLPVTVGVNVDVPAKRLWLSGFTLTPILDQWDEIERRQQDNWEQLKALEAQLDETPEWHDDSYIRMCLAIARRYLKRVDCSGPGGKQGIHNIEPGDPEVERWNLLQTRECGMVLNRLATRMDDLSSGRQAVWMLPSLEGARIQKAPGGFIASDANGYEWPVVLGGYGHFSPVMKDAAFLNEMGVNLVQQERGPRELQPEGMISNHAQTLLDQLAAPAPGGRKIDVLLSPHYMPSEWFNSHPDLAGNKGGGFMKFNIDHPAARLAIADWINTYVPLAAAQPNLFAFCLSNEPGYVGSGRDRYSHSRWVEWLITRHHGSISELNSLYGTDYTSFDEVAVPPVDFPSDESELPAYYDWVVFNQENFAEWHRWMRDLVKSSAPAAWTHAKLMPDIFDTRLRAQRTHSGILARGMDPELITRFSDLAGCDSWSFVHSDSEWSYTWVRTNIWYDLLHSFNGAPVIDSELHAIVDRHPAESLPRGHVYTVLWQGALHHRTAFTSWIWSEPTGHSSLGSIYLRPADVEQAARAQLDLNRLAAEINAVNAAPAHVALLYSPTSLFWQEDYPVTAKELYTILTLLGHKVTFVSERQLVARELPDSIRCVFLPRATHVADATRTALRSLAESEFAIFPIGKGNLAFTPYGRAADASWLPKPWHMGLNRQVDMKHFSTVLQELLGASGTPAPLLDADSGKLAWGVEYRDLPMDGRRLIPLTNLLREPIHLQFPGGGEATDLITGRTVDLSDFYLRPLEPLLLATPLPAEKAQ